MDGTTTFAGSSSKNSQREYSSTRAQRQSLPRVRTPRAAAVLAARSPPRGRSDPRRRRRRCRRTRAAHRRAALGRVQEGRGEVRVEGRGKEEGEGERAAGGGRATRTGGACALRRARLAAGAAGCGTREADRERGSYGTSSSMSSSYCSGGEKPPDPDDGAGEPSRAAASRRLLPASELACEFAESTSMLVSTGRVRESGS